MIGDKNDYTLSYAVCIILAEAITEILFKEK